MFTPGTGFLRFVWHPGVQVTYDAAETAVYLLCLLRMLPGHGTGGWGTMVRLRDCVCLFFFSLGLNFLVPCVYVFAQSCLPLCDPMDCSLLGSSVHGIYQARILEWVTTSFLQDIFLTQGLNLGP